MSDTSLGQQGQNDPVESTEIGLLHMEKKEEAVSDEKLASLPKEEVVSATPLPLERDGQVEHLAARRVIPPLDPEAPSVKERLVALRTTITRLLTDLRWNGLPVEEAAEQLIPLLNFGPIQQWQPILIPYLYEIDRAGNMMSVWLHIIDKGDPHDLTPDANPADHPLGRARRYAILMLGNYKTNSALESRSVGFSLSKKSTVTTSRGLELSGVLRKLATDPNSSMYATHSLAKQGTTTALEALIGALKDSSGWARVDVIEAFLSLNLTRFHDLLIASGLEAVPGLESYVAIPLYRSIALEEYLRGANEESPRLSEQAAMIVARVAQDSQNPPRGEVKTLPAILERNLSTVTRALFERARTNASWQHAYALHHIGVLLGRYWTEISRNTLQDPQILEPVYNCLTMMPDIERWMSGPGRDILLSALESHQDETILALAPILADLRDPRAASALLPYIQNAQVPQHRRQARALAAACDTLGKQEDRRMAVPLQQLITRIIPVEQRSSQTKRSGPLPAKDADVLGSIVYIAAIRALGQLGERNALETILQATNDFDPYVRIQALTALKRTDAAGEDERSRTAAREALKDPNNEVVRSASQLIGQYRDTTARDLLQQVINARPEVAATAYEAMRQLT